jgi:uncharacterized membrane protein
MTFNQLPFLPDWVNSIFFPVNRWLHMVAMALLVGGTLFYEFVIPKAIEDLKEESQLAVLGRVRWIFRGIVLIGAAMLVISGIVSTWRNWPFYTGDYSSVCFWLGLHAGLGLIAVTIAVMLTLGDRVPRHPIAWLRVNFVVMLVALFVADLTVYIRQTVFQELQHNTASSHQDPGAAPSEPTN